MLAVPGQARAQTLRLFDRATSVGSVAAASRDEVLVQLATSVDAAQLFTVGLGDLATRGDVTVVDDLRTVAAARDGRLLAMTGVIGEGRPGYTLSLLTADRRQQLAGFPLPRGHATFADRPGNTVVVQNDEQWSRLTVTALGLQASGASHVGTGLPTAAGQVASTRRCSTRGLGCVVVEWFDAQDQRVWTRRLPRAGGVLAAQSNGDLVTSEPPADGTGSSRRDVLRVLTSRGATVHRVELRSDAPLIGDPRALALPGGRYLVIDGVADERHEATGRSMLWLATASRAVKLGQIAASDLGARRVGGRVVLFGSTGSGAPARRCGVVSRLTATPRGVRALAARLRASACAARR